MIRITDQYFWNFIFSLFFLALVVMAVVILETEAIKSYEDLTIFDITLLSLATYRLIRVFVSDPITKFFREQFWDAKKTKTGIILEKPTRGPRRTLADLMSCPWCFGIWAGASVTFFYLLTPYAFFIILFLAISGIGTFLCILANMIGWKAEQLKHEVEK